MMDMSKDDKRVNEQTVQSPQSSLGQNEQTSLFGEGMIAIARLGQIGRAKDAFVGGMNRLFGEGNWTIGYSFGKAMIDRDAALQLYEDSYVKFFQENNDLLQKLIKEASDVYDNCKSEVSSGTDWYKQEGRSTHLQDIAIRRALIRLGEKFEGKRLRKVKSDGHFPELSPGNVPFIETENVSSNTKVEKKWIKAKSVEDFWQNNKVFLVKDELNVTRLVAARLKEITDKSPPEDQDRFEARRGAEFLAMTGALDRETYFNFIKYTDKIDRLDTLRDWTYNILEMVHSNGFVAEKGSPSEKIVQSVGAHGLYMFAFIDRFDSDLTERLQELSPLIKASFCLAMLEGKDHSISESSELNRATTHAVAELVDNPDVINIIRGNTFYQQRVKNIFDKNTPAGEDNCKILTNYARNGSSYRASHPIPTELEEFLIN